MTQTEDQDRRLRQKTQTKDEDKRPRQQICTHEIKPPSNRREGHRVTNKWHDHNHDHDHHRKKRPTNKDQYEEHTPKTKDARLKGTTKAQNPRPNQQSPRPYTTDQDQ